MSGQLRVIAGPDKGKSFTLEDGQTLVVGRGQASDARINDPHISRVHCEVAFRGGKATLSDSGSSGGTFIGDDRIDSVQLHVGASFRIGGSEVQFDAGPNPDDATLRVDAIGANKSKATLAPLNKMVGQSIKKYQLDSIIAEGSSSTVFRATDTESGSTVAVKVLTPDPYQSDEQKERFVRAMQAMLPIKHPNIVRVLMAGKTGPYCWTAMEYVDGESLEKVIEKIGIRGMLDWQHVFRVAVDITRALQEGFEHKIVHRNLTPANILRRNEDKVCLLGDLMLAKATEGKLAKQVTRPGQIVGNLSYLPPERTYDDRTVDHRSDLYGLGATLYALLTGRPPFESKSMPELVKMIRDEIPKPPKEFQLAVNEGFQDIVMELLQKRPEDRYQKPQDVLRDLERVAKFSGLKMD